MKEKNIKIIIVDDHPIVRKGIKSIIDCEDNITVCGEAEDANGAMSLVGELMPDLVIADITLKGNINGIDLVKAIKSRYPGIKTLTISMYDGALYAERAIRAGSRGYITKEEASENIIAAIHTVMKGELYLSSDISAKMVDILMHGSKDSGGVSISSLSDREFEVFQLIGNGYKRGNIAKKLNININTVESHRRKIKEKLGVNDSAELARLAVQWTISQNT